MLNDHRPDSGATAEGYMMEQAYEDYFNSLKTGEEALSFAEFVESLS